ncbi:putative late blight resistance protein homolog R1A-3 [Solanum stenotomum]|uniref:putative late blight resistance protein homolog R1A-3 n=1 Tax=Solanum stenotomum TaxID=172797 RepID=UPI0020D127D3|nr:putative late blight resistance protein homolog R1A-3 [Solanum stenotomum]
MKTCKIHDLLRQLCLSVTHTENVVHIVNGNVPMFLLEAIDDQRRVIVLSKLEEKQVYPPMHSNGITSIARTFISMQYFQYSDFPEGICSIFSEFKLLKVLDVLNVWLDFSSVIPELVHLRYVAASIEEALSLDKLRNLQTIILQRNIGINSSRELEQPVDIWRMLELRHVDIRSPLYISNPLEAENPLFLNNLQNLYLYNSPFIVEIIRRTPNLKKLKLLIDDSDHPDWPAILDSLILLEDLETLLIKLESIDLNIFSGDILSCKIKKLSPNIKKLMLLGTYIPWEVVNLLANLPNLEVIGGEYAFAGTDWKVDEDVVFHKLKYLQIGEADLERWEATGSDNFPMLEQLILYGLDKLEEIPESIGDIMTLKLIKIDNCSSSVDNSAKRIQQENEDEVREGDLKEAGDDYTASHYILPHLLNLYSSRAKAQDFEIYGPNATFEDPLMHAEGVKQIKLSFYSLGKVFSESRIVEYNVIQKEISPVNKEILIENKQYYKFLGKDIHMISLIKLYTEGGKVVRHEDCWDKKPLWNRETAKVPLVGRVMKVSRRASMLFTDALVGFGKDPSM